MTDTEGEFLLDHLGKKMDEKTLKSCIILVKRHGKFKIEELINDHIRKAVAILDKLPDNETRELLEIFAHHCGSREK